MLKASSSTIPLSSPTRQSLPNDADSVPQSTSVDQKLARWRKAVSACGWTLDALQAHMDKDKSYIHRVLNGGARFTLEFEDALPDDVEAKYHELAAIDAGMLVVERVSDDVARQQLASGLFNLLAPRSSLPTRADSMAKASLPQNAAKVGTR